jgi:hypothetical protein
MRVEPHSITLAIFISVCRLIFVGCSAHAQVENANTVSVLWQTDGPNTIRTPASHVLLYGDSILVGAGGMTVHVYSDLGNFQGTLIDLPGENGGAWSDLEIHNGKLMGHSGLSPGYNIVNSEHSMNGELEQYHNVTEGQSGTGFIVDVDGDWYMAWASNCCGTGQTWDTDIKKFVGHTGQVEWNVEHCYACNSWLGDCHYGFDYPTDLDVMGSQLILTRNFGPAPCESSIEVLGLNLSGQQQWSTIFPFWCTSLKTLVSDNSLYVLGYEGSHTARVPVVHKLSDTGDVLWSLHIPSVDADVFPVDLIELSDGRLLMFMIENDIFRFVTFDSDAEVTENRYLAVNHPPQQTQNEMQRGGYQFVESGPSTFVLAYNWGAWFDGARYTLMKLQFDGAPGCTDPSACNFDPEATANDGSCVAAGCMDAAACNYDAMAGCDDGSCAPAGAVPGCMEAEACNYDAAAVCAGPCVYPAAGGSDCAAGGALCGAGTVWDVASQTCITDPGYLAEATASAVAEALDGVCGEGTVWHPTLGVCVPWQSCPDSPYNPDSNADGAITVIDLLALLSIFEDVDTDGDGLFDSVDDCDGVYDACGVCGGVGLDADADGVCDDADPCVGTLDACGVCNGPGPNVAVLDQIIYATDSLLVPQLGVWYVYEYPIDTLYTYECPQPECSTTSLDTYNVGAPLASFYLNFSGPSSYNAGPRPAGAYALQVSGTYCVGSCWNGHTTDAAYSFNHPFGSGITPLVQFYVNDPCLSGDTDCQNLRPFPDEYNAQHVYYYFVSHPGGDFVVYGLDDCCWGDNQGGLSFQLFECTGN